MITHRWTTAGVAVVALLLAGCAHTGTAAPAITSTATLAQTLRTWDTADSDASAHNDVDALKSAESGAALAMSVAGANAARLTGHPQAQYQHVAPSFVSLTGTPTCVLASASLKLTGEEIALPDFSEFAVSNGSWMLTNHILLARSVSTASTDLSTARAVPADQAVAPARRDGLSAELYARTVGAASTAPGTIGPSALIDRQLLGGWQVYTQQMAKAKVAVTRTLDHSSWSTCAAATGQGFLVFLTMDLTDRIVPAPGGPGTVTLPSSSPDLQSLGRGSAVSGKTIAIDRLESFVLQIPSTAEVPVQVIGMSDAPTAIRTT